MNLTYVPLIVSGISALIAISSLAFAVKSWHRTNRPIISVRITTVKGGNVNITLNIVVENTGNRPAKEITLVADKAAVLAALKDISSQEIPLDAQHCFFAGKTIPVLANGKSATNAFGVIGTDGDWEAGARIPLLIEYRSFEGKRYSEKLDLLLADDAGFAQTFWDVASGQ